MAKRNYKDTESKVSSSYVKQLKTDRRYYERTADGHWEAEDWTIANEYYARANFLSLLEKYYAAKLNNDTEGELKAAETLYKVYTDPEFLVENFYIKKDKEEDKCIYQRAIKPGFLGELKNWDEGDTLIEGIYPDAYDNFVSEVLPEIEKLLDKEHWYFRLTESKLSEAKESTIHGLMEYQDEDCDPISYACYTLDEEGDEVDRFAYEFTYKDAMEACKEKSEETGKATHAVLLYDQNDDDDEEGWAFLDRVGCGPYEVVYTYSPKLTESKESLKESQLKDSIDKTIEEIKEYILMCNDSEDRFSGKKSLELSNKFFIENLSKTYNLHTDYLKGLFTAVESKLMDEGNSLWWKSEAYQESKTKNRKQRIKEDSLDDPDIDLSQSFKGKDLDRLEEFQNDAINFIGAIVEGELQEKGFRKVKFPKKDGYRIFVGGLFSKKIAEPGSNIYITLEIGEYGKIRVGEVDYSAEDLANELCDIIKPLMNGVRFDVYQIYQASIYGDSGQWIIRFNCEVPEDILDETKWIARESKTFKFVEAKLQRAKDISKLLNEASERSDCEQAFFDWFESQAPHYDVSNYDAFEAGARAKGVEVQEENYMAWLEQFAPHYDVSGYDAFEAGWNLA